MTPAQWFAAQKGRLIATAAHFGRSKGAISQWKTKGVPRDLMLAFHQWTKGEVQVAEMLPQGKAHTAILAAPQQAVHQIDME